MRSNEPTEEVKQVDRQEWDAKAIGASITFCLKEIGCPHVIRITKDTVTIDLPSTKAFVVVRVEASEDPNYYLQISRKYEFNDEVGLDGRDPLPRDCRYCWLVRYGVAFQSRLCARSRGRGL